MFQSATPSYQLTAKQPASSTSSSSTSSSPASASASASTSGRAGAPVPRPVPRLPSTKAMIVQDQQHQQQRLRRADTADPSLMRAPVAAPAAASDLFRDRVNSWAPTNRAPTVAPHSMDGKTSAKLQKEMANAAKVVDTFFSPKLLKDQSIPHELLVEANGLVFLTVYKVGFLFSGKVGTGFVIARTAAGWSAPSFLASGGLGFGMMAGGEVVNYMIILNSRGAVKVFTRNGQVQLGSELDLAVGPIGRAASASLNVGRGGIAPNYSYSHSMGLYGGIGLSSGVICTRKSLNAKCYGARVTVRQILGGEVPCPLALPLWQALDRALGTHREFADGFPVPALGGGVTGLACDSCGYLNATETHVCSRCHNLLVYSVGVHSGRRNTSQLVATTVQANASARSG